MLLGQVLVIALSAVKRFDAVALQAWDIARGALGAVRSIRYGSEDLAD